jgi:hypothetical protein
MCKGSLLDKGRIFFMSEGRGSVGLARAPWSAEKWKGGKGQARRHSRRGKFNKSCQPNPDTIHTGALCARAVQALCCKLSQTVTSCHKLPSFPEAHDREVAPDVYKREACDAATLPEPLSQGLFLFSLRMC